MNTCWEGAQDTDSHVQFEQRQTYTACSPIPESRFKKLHTQRCIHACADSTMREDLLRLPPPHTHDPPPPTPCTHLELLQHGLLCGLQALQLACVTLLLQVQPEGSQPVQQHSHCWDRRGSCCALEVLLVGEGACRLLLDLWGSS
jgi:hypothetical protein